MASSTSQTAFLTIEKSFTYRGAREHWVNVYHWDQIPDSSTTWLALAEAVWAREQVFLTADVHLEAYYGHNPGTPPILVYEKLGPPGGAFGPAGTFVPTAAQHQAPGDAAMWVRWGTTQKSKLGKPIYLRNYYHDVYSEAGPDTISGQQQVGLGALAEALTEGVGAGSASYHRAGPRGAVAQNHAVAAYITTRTLKHRGRRHKFQQTRADTPGFVWIQVPDPLGIAR